MTAAELIRFILAPSCIAATIAHNLGFAFKAFSQGETIAIIGMIAGFVGYLAYTYEVDRRARLAEAKERAIAEAERLRREYEQQLMADENQYLFIRNFHEIMSWRDQITGAGPAKEVSPWE